MDLTGRHYLLALALALGLHLAAALVLFWPGDSPQGRAQAAGTGGIEISLGPAGRAAGGPEETHDGEELSEPEPEPEPQLEPEPEPEPESEPEPEPQPDPEPQPEPVVNEQTIKASPVSEPKIRTQPPASVAGAGGRSGTREADHTGSGDNSAGGGLPGSTEDYAATLLAWLEQYKEYPRRARMRRQQGTVLLYFMVDRHGAVLDYRLHESSGYPALDDEVLAMIERAQPLPAMPEDMAREQLELVVPVQFFLR